MPIPQIIYEETDKCYYFTASYPAYGNVNNGYDRIILRKADTISGLSDDNTEITIWKGSVKRTDGKTRMGAGNSTKWTADGMYFLRPGNSDNIWAIRPYVLVCQGDDPYESGQLGAGRRNRGDSCRYK